MKKLIVAGVLGLTALSAQAGEITLDCNGTNDDGKKIENNIAIFDPKLGTGSFSTSKVTVHALGTEYKLVIIDETGIRRAFGGNPDIITVNRQTLSWTRLDGYGNKWGNYSGQCVVVKNKNKI
jgi:hypothetical protein